MNFVESGETKHRGTADWPSVECTAEARRSCRATTGKACERCIKQLFYGRNDCKSEPLLDQLSGFCWHRDQAQDALDALGESQEDIVVAVHAMDQARSIDRNHFIFFIGCGAALAWVGVRRFRERDELLSKQQQRDRDRGRERPPEVMTEIWDDRPRKSSYVHGSPRTTRHRPSVSGLV